MQRYRRRVRVFTGMIANLSGMQEVVISKGKSDRVSATISKKLGVVNYGEERNDANFIRDGFFL
jgi:hypothetical protein